MAKILANPHDKLYFYKAKCIRVIDGDTIHVDWDLGRQTVASNEVIRFLGINTPERGIRGYEAATFYTKSKILDKPIYMKTDKDLKGGFGRYLAEIFYENEQGQWISLNDDLLEKGLAEKYIRR